MVKERNEMRVFNNSKFGEIRVIGDKDNPLFHMEDVCFALGYTRANNQGKVYLRRDRIKKMVETLDITTSVHGGHDFITEDNLYDFILESWTDNARSFRRWVTSEVLPTIRKTGGYVADTSHFVDSYFGNLDETTRQFLVITLDDKKKLMEENKVLKEDVEVKQNEIEYKENLIIGLVDDIDLATKRQRLNEIVRKGYKSPKQISDRWNLLHKEFEKKYRIDLNRRLKSKEALSIKPKIKGKLDYIDRVLNKVPEIYELACKVFENDVEKLKEEWFDVVDKDRNIV